MQYYAHFLSWIQEQNSRRLKFLDESHFQARGTFLHFIIPSLFLKREFINFSSLDFKAKKALAPRGKPATLLKPGLIPDACSITLVTSLTSETHCHWTIRHGSNNQHDFIASLRVMIEAGTIFQRGDFLIMDNAAVHVGRESSIELDQLLQEAGITRVLMPTYSPELNPCEFVFARIKNFIRSPYALAFDPATGREITRDFNELLIDATSRISAQSLEETYRHCRTLNPNSDVANALRRIGYNC